MKIELGLIVNVVISVIFISYVIFRCPVLKAVLIFLSKRNHGQQFRYLNSEEPHLCEMTLQQ